MKKVTYASLLVASIAAAFALGVFVTKSPATFSIVDFLKGRSPQGEGASSAVAATAEGQANAGVADVVAPDEVSFEDVERLLGALAPEQQETIIGDEDRFRQLVTNEADTRSMLAAAIDNQLQQNAEMQFLMRRAAERVLVEAYMNQLIRVNTAEDFPTDEQVEQYYEQNKASFALPKRIHLSQIFWNLADETDEQTRAAVHQRVDAVLRDVRKGTLDFAEAALKYSEHPASRAAGGYMGLLRATDLIPEIRDKVLSMKVGAVSDPIRSSTGIHVIKRGEIVEARELTFDEVKQQARQLLVRDHAASLRAALVAKARESYPFAVDDTTADKWRLQLKTGKWRDKVRSTAGSE
jgi:peptidylprolyl isomerase